MTYDELAAAYLKMLAKRDMAVWRARVSGQSACADDEPLSYERARAIAAMKRVVRPRRRGAAHT
jgi:hypothetical protein